GLSGHTGFWRVQARYLDKLSKDTDVRVVTAFGRDFIEFYLGDNFFTVDTYPLTGRAELSQKLARGITLNTGMDLLYSPYTVHVRLPARARPCEPPVGPGRPRPPPDA